MDYRMKRAIDKYLTEEKEKKLTSKLQRKNKGTRNSQFKEYYGVQYGNQKARSASSK